mgnify:FL=1
MGKLSIVKYAVLCALGGEIAYTVCMLYGRWLTGKAAELHLAIFQLFPGFTDIGFRSWLMGAVTVAVWSLFTGCFIAWMHNTSLKK